ncbi:Hypothetical protein, putative [Bodo saltans]|uniref:Uncharacterized protein n=1 Tax=Bodo saltans TaxID=75058 RepID=A0A0S4J7Y4_BODSA|nr:Hypothetical protein, putative [Bodo saltans]|eukprot:CUG86327.1 Hypothetical protein, putative [Bodo saltans]
MILFVAPASSRGSAAVFILCTHDGCLRRYTRSVWIEYRSPHESTTTSTSRKISPCPRPPRLSTQVKMQRRIWRGWKTTRMTGSLGRVMGPLVQRAMKILRAMTAVVVKMPAASRHGRLVIRTRPQTSPSKLPLPCIVLLQEEAVGTTVPHPPGTAKEVIPVLFLLTAAPDGRLGTGWPSLETKAWTGPTPCSTTSPSLVRCWNSSNRMSSTEGEEVIEGTCHKWKMSNLVAPLVCEQASRQVSAANLSPMETARLLVEVEVEVGGPQVAEAPLVTTRRVASRGGPVAI